MITTRYGSGALPGQALPARCCVGDSRMCHAIFWPVVPDDAKAWWRDASRVDAHLAAARNSPRVRSMYMRPAGITVVYRYDENNRIALGRARRKHANVSAGPVNRGATGDVRCRCPLLRRPSRCHTIIPLPHSSRLLRAMCPRARSRLCEGRLTKSPLAKAIRPRRARNSARCCAMARVLPASWL